MNKASTPKRKANKLPVTQPYVPDISKYIKYVEQAFNRKWLTNGGPLVEELTVRLKELLQIENLLLVNNGTTALQVAYQLKNLSGKTALTTPFTFPATSTAMRWQNTKVKLADIDRQHWNLCPISVRKSLIKSKVQAVVPVNIFGTPCDMEAFDEIGKEFEVPIIYDSAQALLSQYKGKSIFNYGDIHCVSFHATKLFHTVEGGAMTFKSKQDLESASKLINFGIEHNGEVHTPGINAKMSELHAAMGLCVLDELPNLIEQREQLVDHYKKELQQAVEFQSTLYDSYTPPMYMAVKFTSEQKLSNANHALNQQGYQARRYFYPNNHKYIQNDINEITPNADNVAGNILCLPLMHNLTNADVTRICNIVKKEV